MASEFQLEILTPGKELISTEVTEVVLPAHDGEVGVLASHGDFVGLLGTGALKIVKGGDDYWCMVSSGVWEVKDGKLTVLAEIGEESDVVDIESASGKAKELEEQLEGQSTLTSDYKSLKTKLDRERSRMEVHRRTESLH